MAWGCLTFSAFFLWNERVTGNLLQAAYEPIALLLSAFAAFVGVFAWMLFNPNQKTTAETPTLFLAAVATLFPPPIIGFNLMPENSPLRWWLALGIFLLIVIALLSHVPDEFFGVPRGRSTYIMPLPIFDSVADEVMDPKAAWFTFSDLTQIVPDVARPSLAPRAYLNQDQERRNTATAITSGISPTSGDDLWNVDAEIGLLDDTLLDYELDAGLADRRDRSSVRQPIAQTRVARRSEKTGPSKPSVAQTRPRTRKRSSVGSRYVSRRKYSQRLQVEKSSRRTTHSASGYRLTVRDRLADSLKATPVASTTLADAYDRALPQSQANIARDQKTAKRETSSTRTTAQTTKASSSGLQRPPQRPQTESPQKERSRASGASPSSKRSASSKRKSERPASSGDRTSNSLTSGVLPVPLPPIDLPKSDARQSSSDVQDPLSESINAFVSADHESRSSVVDQRLPKRPVQPPAIPTPSDAETTRPATGPDIQRSTDASGSVIVEGSMPIRFEVGQKRANVHIPFSPPLPTAPEVEAECVGEGDLRLKIPVKQTYGIRIEARRTDDSEPLESEIAFAAISE